MKETTQSTGNNIKHMDKYKFPLGMGPPKVAWKLLTSQRTLLFDCIAVWGI